MLGCNLVISSIPKHAAGSANEWRLHACFQFEKYKWLTQWLTGRITRRQALWEISSVQKGTAISDNNNNTNKTKQTTEIKFMGWDLPLPRPPWQKTGSGTNLCYGHFAHIEKLRLVHASSQTARFVSPHHYTAITTVLLTFCNTYSLFQTGSGLPNTWKSHHFFIWGFSPCICKPVNSLGKEGQGEDCCGCYQKMDWLHSRSRRSGWWRFFWCFLKQNKMPCYFFKLSIFN